MPSPSPREEILLAATRLTEALNNNKVAPVFNDNKQTDEALTKLAEIFLNRAKIPILSAKQEESKTCASQQEAETEQQTRVPVTKMESTNTRASPRVHKKIPAATIKLPKEPIIIKETARERRI